MNILGSQSDSPTVFKDVMKIALENHVVFEWLFSHKDHAFLPDKPPLPPSTFKDSISLQISYHLDPTEISPTSPFLNIPKTSASHFSNSDVMLTPACSNNANLLGYTLCVPRSQNPLVNPNPDECQKDVPLNGRFFYNFRHNQLVVVLHNISKSVTNVFSAYVHNKFSRARYMATIPCNQYHFPNLPNEPLFEKVMLGYPLHLISEDAQHTSSTCQNPSILNADILLDWMCQEGSFIPSQCNSHTSESSSTTSLAVSSLISKICGRFVLPHFDFSGNPSARNTEDPMTGNLTYSVTFLPSSISDRLIREKAHLYYASLFARATNNQPPILHGRAPAMIPLPTLYPLTQYDSIAQANRRKRVIERRERNRALATASNQRRKENYDQLVRNLNSLRSRACLLRDRLNELQKENGQLREAVEHRNFIHLTPFCHPTYINL